MLSVQDKQHIINCLVRTIYLTEATDPERPKQVAIQLEDDSVLKFEQAHWILRGYKGEVPGIGMVQVLEQNPSKTGSWCGQLVNKYQFKVCWLWVDNKYNRCIIDLGDKDVLFFDATGGANECRELVKRDPRIRAIIKGRDADRGAFTRAQLPVKHFE